MWVCIYFQPTSSDNKVWFQLGNTIWKRWITWASLYASPGFIYTHSVNSTESQLGCGPDHYLTTHSAVSQSYLNKWPLLNLWLCSSSLVRSQTLKRKQFSSCVHGFSCKSVLQICLQNLKASLKTSNKGFDRAENWEFIFRNKISNIWWMTPNVIYLSLWVICFWYLCEFLNRTLSWL